MAQTMRSRQWNSGFTLIEMLIVVAIIGILAAVAWSAYVTQQRKSWRADGAVALTNARQALIAFRSDNGAYPATPALANAALALYKQTAPDVPSADCTGGRGYQRANLQSCQNYYAITATASNADTFLLTATPLFVPGVGEPPIECTTLTLDHLGNRGNTPASTPVGRCWAE